MLLLNKKEPIAHFLWSDIKLFMYVFQATLLESETLKNFSHFRAFLF